ncbi:MAG: hypothetical protein KHZ77_01220 [Veillonella sp.]|uniref:hypothetical protein n=1 Tax=Veillonella sp. TaxID=1926307 RepID=UPI0026012C44|nr:hypothetical protein [Veillonella sp.]MBS4912768.1 hypothetical protein [Veillonella sp.]
MTIENLSLQVFATLWENTYRVVAYNQNEEYTATARVIVSIPLSGDALPPNAPEAEPQLHVLVEDSLINAEQIIEFETIFAAKLREKFQYNINTIFFFYPSPEDMLNK